MRIVSLRHGRTQANDARLYCGRTDLSLSESGRAELVELQKNNGYPDITGMRVFTSGMKRTDETLQAIYGEVEHTALDALREMDFGAFEMHSYEQLKDVPEYRAWCEGDNEANIAPGGESGNIMTRRVLECFDGLLRGNEDFVIVSHGGPVSAIMAHLFRYEGKNRYQWQPPNGRGYLLSIDGRTITYESIPRGGDQHVGKA